MLDNPLGRVAAEKVPADFLDVPGPEAAGGVVGDAAGPVQFFKQRQNVGRNAIRFHVYFGRQFPDSGFGLAQHIGNKTANV